MRVAALYDIHGNLPALDSVLREIDKERVDLIVVGGDIVPGVLSKQSLQRLMAIEIPTHFIYGNCEMDLLAIAQGRGTNLPEGYRKLLSWCADDLKEFIPTLSTWPKTITLEIHGLGKVLFCHGTPRDENEIFTSLTDEAHLLEVFEGVDASLIVCGHTHMQFDRMVGGMRVVNAGSVGMPFGEPGARWLLLGPKVETRNTVYDLEAAATALRTSAYPGTETFITQYLLDRPSEAEMLAEYSAMVKG